MPTNSDFSTRLIGQTEKALNAILDRELAGTGLTEPQWVTLTLVAMSAGALDTDALTAQLATALKRPDGDAFALLQALADAGLIELSRTTGSPVTVSEAGAQLHARIRSSVADITQRLWGDLPAERLEIAAEVLGAVLERANRELSRGDR
jgi:DNA-binding MarR family transcriptional regulator